MIRLTADFATISFRHSNRKLMELGAEVIIKIILSILVFVFLALEPFYALLLAMLLGAFLIIFPHSFNGLIYSSVDIFVDTDYSAIIFRKFSKIRDNRLVTFKLFEDTKLIFTHRPRNHSDEIGDPISVEIESSQYPSNWNRYNLTYEFEISKKEQFSFAKWLSEQTDIDLQIVARR